MTSFQLSVSPHRRAAARFVSSVRRALQKAYAESPEVSQTDIAKELDVHRSVINRQLRGYKDMSLGRVAEIAWALGYEPSFVLEKAAQPEGCNTPVWTGCVSATVGPGSRVSTNVNTAGQFVVLENINA